MSTKQAHFPKDDVIGGPYSPAVSVGDQVYIAGQGPISPETKQITGDTFEEQVELTFRNLASALESAGCTLDDCVKLNVYLTDLANFERFNAIYKTKFNEPYPARTTVQAVLWHHLQVEIDAIAVRGSGKKG